MPTRRTDKVQHHRERQTFMKRLPAVQQASAIVQMTMGVSPGNFVQGRMDVGVWEMPVAPAFEYGFDEDEVMEEYEGDYTDDESDDDDEDEADKDEDEDSKDEVLGTPLTGFPAITIQAADEKDGGDLIQQMRRGLLKGGILSASTPNPMPAFVRNVSLPPWIPEPSLHRQDWATTGSQLDVDQVKPEQVDETRQIISHHGASPPTYWFTPHNTVRERGDRPPRYWQTELSVYIWQWLEQPTVKSRQVTLSSLDLYIADHPQCQAFFNTTSSSKLKITQFRISPDHPQVQGILPHLLDWLVIEVKCKPEFPFYDDRQHLSREEKATNPRPMRLECKGQTPYWIMAFPVSAVSTYTIVDDANHTSVQESMWTGRTKREAFTATQTTSVTLGEFGKLPVTHGLGIKKRFVERWMCACAVGKAVIKMQSEEEAPLQLI